MFKQINNHLFLPISISITCLFYACSNSDYVNIANTNDNTNKNTSTEISSSGTTSYIPLDDTEYPYAGIPRFVIETENLRQIRDRETEIPAKMQIYGAQAPESEIMDLTIRGRGNTSWTDMPKKSYKIEFDNKQALLGMPKDRDWTLIANYADKTLMKNYLMYHLSTKLGAYYSPRCAFVELFLNKEYLGVYLLTEKIKISKNRINIPQNNDSYVIEFDSKIRNDEQAIHSSILSTNSKDKIYRIHEPRNANQATLNKIENQITSFEKYLKGIRPQANNNINNWIDINEYIIHYWLQEFSKNPDAAFLTSVFFTWQNDSVIKMGPAWDFDLAIGGHNSKSINSVQDWYLKDSYWNKYVFSDSVMVLARIQYWLENRTSFISTIDVADSIQNLLENASKNNFKKWNILESTEYSCHLHSYKTYKEAVNDLKTWIKDRISWIDLHLNE